MKEQIIERNEDAETPYELVKIVEDNGRSSLAVRPIVKKVEFPKQIIANKVEVKPKKQVIKKIED